MATNFPELAERFIEEHYTLGETSTLRRYEGNWWVWRHHHYTPVLNDVIRAELYDFFRDSLVLSKSAIDNLMDSLKAAVQVRSPSMPCWVASGSHYPRPEDVLAFTNGWLSIPELLERKPRLNPPTPLWFSSEHCAFNYRPNDECPTWLRCLNDWFPDDPDSQNLLQEWFGYCLTSDTAHHKFLFLIGPPRTGKSTILNVLQTLLGGTEQVASTTLQSLGGEFGLQPLIGKNLVQMGEFRISNTKDHSEGLQRMISIIGEDPMYVRRKRIDDLASYKFTTRFMVAGNMVPRLSDSSGALLERMLLLDLEYARPIIDCPDTGLYPKLISEASGILNWAIEGLIRLRTNGRFSQPQTSTDRRNEFELELNPLSEFVRECLTVSPNVGDIPAADLYYVYTKWHEKYRAGRSPFTSLIFGRYLTGAASGRIRLRRATRVNPEPHFVGCRLTPSWAGLVKP
jgi:putative DNA primase/helicase